MSNQAQTAQANTANNRNMPINNRAFQIQEKKSYSLAKEGTFVSRLVELCFLGKYRRTFINNGITTTKDYEMVGLHYRFVDLNTGELCELLTECILSYIPDSRLYRHIVALNGGQPLAQDTPLKTLIGKAATIEIIHRESNGKTYANVKSVNVVNPNAQQPEALKEGEGIFYDIQQHDQAAYEKMNGKHRWLIENRSHEKGSNPTPPQPVQQNQVQQGQGQQMPDANDIGAFMKFWQGMRK